MPLNAARISAVCWLLTLTSALASMSFKQTSSMPLYAAQISADPPSLSLGKMSAVARTALTAVGV